MSLASYCIPLYSNSITSKDKQEINNESKNENESSHNLMLFLNKNNENKKKEYKTFVTLAKERKFKIYLNKKDKFTEDPKEICSSMIIKNLNHTKSDSIIMRNTQSKLFKSTFLTENKADDLLKTKNSFRFTKESKFLPELKEKLTPSLINITAAVINSVKQPSTATIDPDFFIKHLERIPNKSKLLNFTMNPKLNKTANSMWRKKMTSADGNRSYDENTSVIFEKNLYYSNAFNKFHPKSTKISKPPKILNQPRPFNWEDPLAVKSNMRQEMKKRNLLAASRSDLKEIVKIKADLLEFYRELNDKKKEDNITLKSFNPTKNITERNIEDYLDSNELNVLGYNRDNHFLGLNMRAHSINFEHANNKIMKMKKLGKRNFSYLKKEASNILTQEESEKKLKQLKKIKKSIPMLQCVSEHLIENKNIKDKDDLKRRMHNQDKIILHILKKINPNKEDLNKIFKKKNMKEFFID